MTLTQAELFLMVEVLTCEGESVVGELGSKLVSGGRSNVTYVLRDDHSQWILRMPPRVGRTPSAHDIGREFRVAHALERTAVPVARQIFFSGDEGLLGAPFSIAQFVEGRAVRTQSELEILNDEQLDRTVEGMLTALASLHSVIPEAIGLHDFGRPSGYAERQLRRWSGQWDIVGSPGDAPLADEIIEKLRSAVPGQRVSRVVHGDFRIDNTLIDVRSDTQPKVSAVVDWELSTLGDPVADVAMMCAYRDPAFDLIVGSPSAWTSERIPDATSLANRYMDAGGVELEFWNYHLALAYFKIGVIAAGIEHRRRAGFGTGSGFDSAAQAVPRYFQLALSVPGLAAAR